MRAFGALLVLGLAACGGTSGECEVNGDCGGGTVCARNGECLPASSVRAVRTSWTILGQPASSTSCASTPTFYLMFYGFDPGDAFGYSPVPCEAGLFTIDKLPTRFLSVEIGVMGNARITMEKPIDANGNVVFDLTP
jgi:hypothetical protein